MDAKLREWVLVALDYVAARGPLWPLGVAIRWSFVFYLELRRDLAGDALLFGRCGRGCQQGREEQRRDESGAHG